MKNDKTASPTAAELLRDLKSLVAEGEALIADSVTEQSAGAIDSLRSRFNAAQEHFTDTYAGARKRVIAGAKYTDHAIRENPYQALAITLGVGLLVGVLLGRRTR